MVDPRDTAKGSGDAARWTIVTFPTGGAASVRSLLSSSAERLRGMRFRIVSIEGAAGYPSDEAARALLEGRCSSLRDLTEMSPTDGEVVWTTLIGSEDSEWLAGAPTPAECDERASFLAFCLDASDWTISTRDPAIGREVAGSVIGSAVFQAASGVPALPVRWDGDATH